MQQDAVHARRRRLGGRVRDEALQHAPHVDGPLGLEQRLKRGVFLRARHERQRVVRQEFLRARRVRAARLDEGAQTRHPGGKVHALFLPAGELLGALLGQRALLPSRRGQRREDGEVDLQPELDFLRVQVREAVLLGDAPVEQPVEVEPVAILEKRHELEKQIPARLVPRASAGDVAGLLRARALALERLLVGGGRGFRDHPGQGSRVRRCRTRARRGTNAFGFGFDRSTTRARARQRESPPRNETRDGATLSRHSLCASSGDAGRASAQRARTLDCRRSGKARVPKGRTS